MSLTLYLLLINAGLIALFTTLLFKKRMRNVVFFSLTALLITFDFAVISLDKIYLLHKAEDDRFLEKIAHYEAGIAQQLALYRRLTSVQIEATLTTISQPSASETEQTIQQKIQWRDEMLDHLNVLGFDQSIKNSVQTRVNEVVHRFLMESLNKLALEVLGHRQYAKFVNSRPREEWSDGLFVTELEVFTKQAGVMTAPLERMLNRIRTFDQSGTLLPK